MQIIIGLSDVYASQNDYDRSIVLIDQILSFSDIEASERAEFLFKKLDILITAKKFDRIPESVQQILLLLPAENSLQEYICYRFVKLTETLISIKMFVLANQILNSAKTISNSSLEIHETIKEHSDYLSLRIEREKNLFALREQSSNSGFSPAVFNLLLTFYQQIYDEISIEEGKKMVENYLKMLSKEIKSNPALVNNSFMKVKQTSILFSLNPNFFNEYFKEQEG